jgi:hypothetical protein
MITDPNRFGSHPRCRIGLPESAKRLTPHCPAMSARERMLAYAPQRNESKRTQRREVIEVHQRTRISGDHRMAIVSCGGSKGEL